MSGLFECVYFIVSILVHIHICSYLLDSVQVNYRENGKTEIWHKL